MSLYDSAGSLSRAVHDFLGEFPNGLPKGGLDRLEKLREAYSKMAKYERDRYRRDHREQYDHWISRTRRRPPLDAEQPEMFARDPKAVAIEDKLARWEGRAQPAKMGD